LGKIFYSNDFIDFQHVASWAKQEESGDSVLLSTDRGGIRCLFHKSTSTERAIIWVWGVKGGFDGPANSVYGRLAESLMSQDIASLRVDYRRPGDLHECILDVLVSLQFLVSGGYKTICLVGHSFGGAVVISAGSVVDEVKAVIALSSQTLGADRPDLLHPRPLLLIHGMEDRNLPHRCSEMIYESAVEPKELVLLAGTGHGLRQSADEVESRIRDFVIYHLGSNTS